MTVKVVIHLCMTLLFQNYNNYRPITRNGTLLITASVLNYSSTLSDCMPLGSVIHVLGCNTFYAAYPMPISLMKECPDVLISAITNIINKSLSLSVFQD